MLPVSEIARAVGIPGSFLAKIFQKLVRHDVVRSFRGTIRGYALARPPETIRVREVLDAADGPGLFERCVFWDARCGDQDPCPLHEGWKQVRPQFLAFLDQTTLDDLARGRGWAPGGAWDATRSSVVRGERSVRRPLT